MAAAEVVKVMGPTTAIGEAQVGATTRTGVVMGEVVDAASVTAGMVSISHDRMNLFVVLLDGTRPIRCKVSKQSGPGKAGSNAPPTPSVFLGGALPSACVVCGCRFSAFPKLWLPAVFELDLTEPCCRQHRLLLEDC